MFRKTYINISNYFFTSCFLTPVWRMSTKAKETLCLLPFLNRPKGSLMSAFWCSKNKIREIGVGASGAFKTEQIRKPFLIKYFSVSCDCRVCEEVESQGPIIRSHGFHTAAMQMTPGHTCCLQVNSQSQTSSPTVSNWRPPFCQLGERLKFTPAHPNWIIKSWKMLPAKMSLYFCGAVQVAVRAWSKLRESMILCPFTYRNAPEYCCWRPPRQPQSPHANMAPSSNATHTAEITSHCFRGHKREV